MQDEYFVTAFGPKSESHVLMVRSSDGNEGDIVYGQRIHLRGTKDDPSLRLSNGKLTGEPGGQFTDFVVVAADGTVPAGPVPFGVPVRLRTADGDQFIGVMGDDVGHVEDPASADRLVIELESGGSHSLRSGSSVVIRTAGGDRYWRVLRRLRVDVYAGNDATWGEDVRVPASISVPAKYAYRNHWIMPLTVNARGSLREWVDRTSDGRVRCVTIEATAPSRDTGGPRSWAGGRLTVWVERGRVDAALTGGCTGGPPPPAEVIVERLTLTRPQIQAGESTVMIVRLNRPAPTGGRTVAISSITTTGLTDTLTSRPVSIQLNAGVQEGAVELDTRRVTEDTTRILFTASLGNSSQSCGLTIT